MRYLFSLFSTLFFLPLLTAPTYAAQANTGIANPIVLILVMGALALAPFALIMMTSFVKLSVVLAILRNALCTQQAPPNQVITGTALVLTIFIMAPVGEKMYQQAGYQGNLETVFNDVSVKTIFEATQRGKEPLRDFLKRHGHEPDRKMFYDLSRKIAQRNSLNPDDIQPDDFRNLMPAFVTSQLTEAFNIGFLLFLPFLVIDMVVSSILQAMGMFMLSPVTISLPFKILLFALIDGWVLLIKYLVLGYA
ncbi:MAG: type III secretion system export apparatus subunit SctR [Blastocatellia bacterium]